MSGNRKIKISFVHQSVGTAEEIIELLKIGELSFAEDIVVDNEFPDYVVCSDEIFSHPEYMEKFKRLIRGRNPVRIFWTEESASPDFNIFDYAICCNYEMEYLDRVVRMPPHIFIGMSVAETTKALSYDEAKLLLADGKRKFCSFICSNSRAHPKRDELFCALCGYKKVDSLGQHLNNIGMLITGKEKWKKPGMYPLQQLHRGGGGTWRDISIRLKGLYKFSIAAENACSDGYTSEKLFTSFLAHTVPIYWGNPYVAEEYNPEAFVNCNDYDSLDGVVKRVREIDENDDLWAHIVSQPWQTEEQQRRSEAEYEHYKKFMTNIFSQPLDKAIRRSEGYYSRVYGKWFFDGVFAFRKFPFFIRLIRILLNPKKLWEKLKTYFVKEIYIEDYLSMRERQDK